MKRVLFLLATLGLLGCATGGGTSHHHVMIGLEPEPQCKKLGRVECTAWSKPELKTSLKSKAAGLGANFVKLDSVVRNGKGYEAKGTAFACR